MDEPIRVMIVEDDADHAARFADLVRRSPRLALAGVHETAAAAIAHLEREAPDVLLADLGLPDADGTQVIRRARQLCPHTDILVVTVFGDEAHVLASIEAGAAGYLLKDALPSTFEETVLELRRGGSPISPLIARQLLLRLRPTANRPGATLPTPEDAHLLSNREREVLQAIAKGFSYAEIAEIHGITVNTVTSHVKNIYRKLEVHSRGQAVFEAGQRGLLT
jgi:DNA-binding NarL/FixJ family response regulator